MSRPRLYDLKNDEELKKAQWEAVKGGANGAARYGAIAGVAGLAAYFYSPVYRGLTIQFKVFLQLSAMALGGFVEADRRLIQYEQTMRRQHRIKRDAAIWRSYEREFERAGIERQSKHSEALAPRDEPKE